MGAQGKTTIDFGAFPGKADASVDVTGQAGILAASSLVEAWLYPQDTGTPGTNTFHTEDEHLAVAMRVQAGQVVDGVGFTIKAFCVDEKTEPLAPTRGGNNRTLAGALTVAQGFQRPTQGGKGPRLWGVWTVAWVWN
jgi:hypothetical protein